MSERNPLILTSRRYRRVFDDLEAARSELEEVGPFIGLAKEIRDEITHDVSTTASGQQAVADRAVEQAKERERQRIIDEYANEVRVHLTEEQQAQLRQEFIEQHRGRIDAEVADEVARLEKSHREQVAYATERELKQLKRDELLEEIGTDEARATAQRFGRIALDKIKHEAMIEELKAKAEVTSCVNLSDLPLDTVLNIGFDSKRPQTYSGQGVRLSDCNRVLTLRVVNVENAALEVMDDSWMSSDDIIRRENALEDMELILLPRDNGQHRRARFSRGVEPAFLDQEKKPIDMYGLEVQTLKIGEESIF